ncbi:MAG: gamma-glutamyltransferase [Gammaproteobacteria bacterium]|nr:gamma-glutamyltransferase [Gammaproteobacteria bacterium]
MNIKSGRSAVIAGNGMVATSQPLATDVGLGILKKGGSAVDAAIAANAALGLMEPHMCGVGGDLFAIVWDEKEQQLHGLNASGRSPGSLDHGELSGRLRRLGTRRIPANSILSVSVPGAVHGWTTLHDRFGKLPFAELLAPAIRYAERGFPVSPVIAGQWRRAAAGISGTVPGAFDTVYAPGGRVPDAGDIFTNKDLARTYRLIADNGNKAFYRDELADRLVAFMKENGGYIDHADLQAYRSDWITPVSVNYRGHDVYELPPSGQGIAALQMLQMLKDDDLASMGFMNVDCLHLMLEAKKLVFEDRAKFYADPDFTELQTGRLLSGEYSKKRRALVKDSAALRVRAGERILRDGDTIYLTVADSAGNMVSLIQSVYHYFGSGIVVPGTGFDLQNRGMSFSMDPSHANVYAPGKRPFHTIIPAFVIKDDKPFMSFGVMGGDMQPQGHVQVLANIIDFGMNVQLAGDAPRWRHDGSTEPTADVDEYLTDGGVVLLERGFPDQVVKELAKRGHHVQRATDGFGGYQAIIKADNGVYHGASESRKDGQAAGY